MSKPINNYLLTLRCHPNDTQLFEDYITLIKTWINEDDRIIKYSWSIERDETIHRHLHLYLVCTSFKDSSKLYDRLKTKEFKSIQIKLNKSKTIFNTAFKIDKITETPKKALGYTQKWNGLRRDHKGFTDDEIIDAIEYYYTTTRLDKSEEVKDDWIYVTTKNFFALVEDFVRKDDELSFKDSDLIKLKMVKAGHTFIGMSSKQEEKAFRELRIRREACTQSDEFVTSNEAHGLERKYGDLQEEEIVDLLRYIISLKDKDMTMNIPGNVFAIYKKYEYLYDFKDSKLNN